MSTGRAIWIGGAPGAGKTTVASRLARRHGLRLYSADTRTWEHRDRALAAGNEHARRWEALSRAERAQQPPESSLALTLHYERGPMVLADVEALPAAPLVVAEGTTIPAGAEPSLWLIPTREHQRAMLEARGLPKEAAAYYAFLRDVIERDAGAVLHVDGSLDVDATVAAVEAHFADVISAAPRAERRGERQALLREANLAIVEQLRGFYARPWANGDAETVTREFLCECGDTSCVATVVTSVGAAAAAPVLS